MQRKQNLFLFCSHGRNSPASVQSNGNTQRALTGKVLESCYSSLTKGTQIFGEQVIPRLGAK